MKDLSEARRIVEQQRGEIERLRDDLAEVKKDAALLQQFTAWADAGYCPALVFDDNGHWAVSFDGVGTININDDPEDGIATFFVRRSDWRDSVQQAIEAAIAAIEQEQSE